MPEEKESHRCSECIAKVANVEQRAEKIDARVTYLERENERNMREVRDHMRNEDNVTEKIFSELRQLRDQLTGIVTTALRDRNDMERTFADQFAKHDEANRQRFVTKNEVRVGWAVAVIVMAGAVWFFTYMQDHSTQVQFDKLTDRIVKELKR